MKSFKLRVQSCHANENGSKRRQTDHKETTETNEKKEGICKKNIIQITDSIINNRVSEQTKHFTMESLILAQDER